MTASELQQLKAEEKMLISIASKLNDQLNRLKVEELELMSRIRARTLGTEPSVDSNKNQDDAVNNKEPDLDLTLATFGQQENGEEEEEEL